MNLAPEPEGESGWAEKLRERGNELIGRRSEPELSMPIDLCEVYTMAAGVSVDWEMLGQAAQGIKNRELLDFTARSHPDNLRQMRWANGKLKETCTQILIS